MGANSLRAMQAAVSIKSYWQRLLREGPSFHQWMRTIAELEAAGEDARREFQLQALREIARHAYANVPFWQRRFRDAGFDPERIADTSDLTRLPVLTKREVRDNLADMVSRRHFRVLLSRGVTSGTTGTPGVYYRDLRSLVFENAMLWHLRSQVGMPLGSRIVCLRGDVVVPSNRSEPPFWIENAGGSQLQVSTYHLTPVYCDEILQAMDSYRALGAFAYPSAVYVVARWCREEGRKLPFPSLHTSSETLLAEQDRVIREVLTADWVDHYGQAERVNLFARFGGDAYRDYTEYGVTELIPRDGPGYDVVGTTLHNFAMPLFRYRTGDVVAGRESDGARRPKICGLAGRQEDYVVLPDGTPIGRLDLVFKGLDNIEEGQIHQSSNRDITIRIVRGQDFRERDERALLRNARDRLGESVVIRVEYLESIPRTQSGKFRFVVSEVKL